MDSLLSLKTRISEQYAQAQTQTSDFRSEITHLQTEFQAWGRAVKTAVNMRTELHAVLDSHFSRLCSLEAEDAETGLDRLNERDPLRFIESSYPYFHDAAECSDEDMCNIEDPKKCLETMENFVHALQANLHRFKHLPLGPLYKSAIAKEKRWAPLSEYVLHPFLFTFLVDNIVDSLVLDELLNEHFPDSKPGSVNKHGVIRPQQFVFSFHSQYEIGPTISSVSGLEVENMLDVVQFDNHTWAKFLSYKISIEKVVFMDNEHAAFLLMSTIRHSPWQCNAVYTLDGFSVRPFPFFQTKRLLYEPQVMYLQFMPNPEIGVLKWKIRKTEKEIAVVIDKINVARQQQLKMAKLLDDVKNMIVRAEAQEMDCLNMLNQITSLVSTKSSSD